LRRLKRNLQGLPRFVDASVFVSWLKTEPRKALESESALLSGYILYKIEAGEPTITTVSIKDEVAIWLSRYRAANLRRFLELLTGYTSMEIVAPTSDDQLEAGKMLGRFKLGFTDLLSVSVMRRLGLKEIYSSDTGFDSVPDVKRLFSELKHERGFEELLSLLKEGTS